MITAREQQLIEAGIAGFVQQLEKRAARPAEWIEGGILRGRGPATAAARSAADLKQPVPDLQLPRLGKTAEQVDPRDYRLPLDPNVNSDRKRSRLLLQHTPRESVLSKDRYDRSGRGRPIVRDSPMAQWRWIDADMAR